MYSVTFSSELVLRHVEGDTYALDEPFVCDIRHADRGEWRVTVPAEFRTDLDSVPRIPFVYAIFKGRATKSAVLHDYLVRNPDLFPKDEADLIFYFAMKEEGLPWWLRTLMYVAVRFYTPPAKSG